MILCVEAKFKWVRNPNWKSIWPKKWLSFNQSLLSLNQSQDCWLQNCQVVGWAKDLYKGTEHSLKISLLQLHPWGWMGVDDLNHNITECTEFFARLWKMKNLIMSSASTCFTFFQNKNIGSKQSYRGFWIPPTL